MKKVRVVISFLIFVSAVNLWAQEIDWLDISRGNSNFRALLICPDYQNIIYAGSGNRIIKSEDGGASWRDILSVRGQKKEVNFLAFGQQERNCLYAATSNGLFFSSNQGRSWSRIFKGKNDLENECTTVIALTGVIYLGTKAGLFVSFDKGRSWHKATGRLGNSEITAISCSLKEERSIYVACADGLFKTQDAGNSWDRIFISLQPEKNNATEEILEEEYEETGSSIIRYISIDPNSLSELYLATRKGIYKSPDKGKSWHKLPSYGLLSRDIRFILISKESNIFAVTKSGVFEYKNGRWQELSLGLSADQIRFLALDNQKNLYAVCDKGLFRASIKYSAVSWQDNSVALYCKDEPKINEVQEAAVRYAEVEPEKILQWRRQAKNAAFLPKVSAGIKRDTSDLWHWESGSTTKAGDDLLVRGKETVGWDISLSWDLSELLWNESQTSIDARSRLMVQLRDDILDEVNKLYFERIRVKMGLDNLSIEDQKKRLEKELRLEELAASLDALTGGYFSRRLKEAKPKPI